MYAQFAFLYHLTHSHFKEDINFILELAQNTSGNILELGCGTGRLLIPLAQAGFSVSGLDNSADMLAIAQQEIDKLPPNTQAHIKLIEDDMKYFNLGHDAFELIIISHNTLMHFDSMGMRGILAAARHALIPNGLLLIDLANPFILEDFPDQGELEFEQRLVDADSGVEIDQFSRNWLDESRQTFHVSWLFTTGTPSSKFPVRAEIQVAYHYLFPHELNTLLQEEDLEVIDQYGDYSRNSFSEESGRLIVIAQKC